ncbi:ABC transporter ATP-binding protein [Paenibacillus polymyxa]|uniref:ABC transporter ATP-binding protein n=1 Tax=Paenibacillus polymyxa TaxID=1406 RepID=UPI0025B69079|nr:ABC transporter ATP-binding protein [Paenibacillus polymyxa]MDN4085391.1 ABC transporter ATP-binding protein [Paenibacillus polymyxa]MDN4090792.1 ABC transporter ATP-binding protein [Paenibacillus polymyxa]MDN4111397.1 ABC transporter ATP-binding protein [Paenibacillus polymyxa]
MIGKVEVNQNIELENPKNPNRGIWMLFLKLCLRARLPYVWIIVYCLISIFSSKLYLLIPSKTGELFAGNVSVQLITVIIVSQIAMSLIGQINGLFESLANAKIDRNFRNVIWDKVLKLTPSYFDKIPASNLISRITLDTEKLRNFIMQVLIAELLGIYVFYITLSQISNYDPSLTYLLLALIPVVMIISFIFGRLFMKASIQIQDKLAGLTLFMSELISSVPVIKAFNREERESKRGNHAIHQLYDAQKRLLYIGLFQFPVNSIFSLAQTLILLLIGIPLLQHGRLDVATWYAFYMFANNLLNMVANKGSQWEAIKTTQGSLLRVAQVLKSPEEGMVPYVKEAMETGDIHFNRVSFRYDDSSEVLNNATFTIPHQRTSVVIGPSGVGKTTILKLLERLYEPSSGNIVLNGSSINQYNPRTWRQDIAYVSQEAPLMSGTIKENILFGLKREVSNEDIVVAAALANAHTFITGFPDGYETQVGQFGSKLSGGQRQRIAIARAILQNPKIFVLDEPTTALDPVAKSELMKGLENLKKDRTVIIVTHDSKVIRHTDHIIVLNKDRSVSSGSHSEMIMSNLFYQNMMNR